MLFSYDSFIFPSLYSEEIYVVNYVYARVSVHMNVIVGCLAWVLGMEIRPSVRALRALNC